MNAKQLKEFMRRYAGSQGVQLNPDEKTVGSVIRGLLYNEEKFGRRYCPCRAITGDPEQDRTIICPCAYHKDELERMGHCLCGLFVKS